MDNYRLLYELALKAFDEERARFSRVDQKAAWLFPGLTLMIGLSGFFAKWCIERSVPPKTSLEWGLLTLSIVTFLLLLWTWHALLKVLQLSETYHLPLTDEVLRFYSVNQLVDVYFHMARQLKNWREYNIRVTDAKTKRLTIAYRCMIMWLVSVTLLCASFVGHEWPRSRLNREASRSESMATTGNPNSPTTSNVADAQQPSPSPTAQLAPNPSVIPPQGQVLQAGVGDSAPSIGGAPIPNPNVVPPAGQLLNEGYVPPARPHG